MALALALPIGSCDLDEFQQGACYSVLKLMSPGNWISITGNFLDR